MKTQIHIAIDIDTDKDGKTRTDAGKNVVDTIWVRKDLSREFGLGDESVFAATCHELGHVMAKRLGLPAHQKDPRMTGGDYMAVLASPDAVVAAEVEAWEVAQKIFDGARALALRAYKRGLYSNPIQWFPTFTEDVLKKAPTEAK